MNAVRCAIYTRKSSEEGLEQDFNSLDAQRDACAAYILSQASEGWQVVPEHYDDGGLSGGTLERPGLQRLLEDVKVGRIDIIVVYKVDRLTRSLLDFARLVEAFDAAGTSFVSVTQSFNTTTSMGRLTLNMLLSFAQFEREVTAERIRDKIAASKARGMWMGGIPPLGYRPDGRSLAMVDEHAAIIRDIYARYRELRNVRRVAETLERDGIVTPRRSTAAGRPFGNCRFTRGQIYAILKNPIYAGDIAHKGTTYPGNHPPIIPRDEWDAVQRQLADKVQGERRTRERNASLLASLLFDEQGEPLIPVHTAKGLQRYRYYVRKSDQLGAGSPDRHVLRIPAPEIEQAVCQELASFLSDPLALANRAGMKIVPAMLATLGIFAAAGVGKTSLLEQIARQTCCDRVVLCLVGERGREVDVLWRMLQESPNMARSTLVAATADESASLRLRAIEQAVGLAEHWRDEGEHVLLLVDSVTRVAHALRELGLAAGLPPSVRGLTPNVFSILPRMVERCGAARGGGAITAVFTVLSETDDVDDPVVELMKSVLDGHIVRSRQLAEKRHFPAIDLSRSVSRLAGDLLDEQEGALSGEAHALIATYEEARPMIESGLYRSGASERIDRAIALQSALSGFLAQKAKEHSELAETTGALARILTAGNHA